MMKNLNLNSCQLKQLLKKSNEWLDIDIETNDRDNDDKANTYYEINSNNENSEEVQVDLSNDIAINPMLLDQGAPYNPDAEPFDINEFNAQNQHDVSHLSSQATKDSQQESFDYLPYHHQTGDKRQSIIK